MGDVGMKKSANYRKLSAAGRKDAAKYVQQIKKVLEELNARDPADHVEETDSGSDTNWGSPSNYK